MKKEEIKQMLVLNNEEVMSTFGGYAPTGRLLERCFKSTHRAKRAQTV
ncbi:MAG: hypothetical protein Q4G63_02360 [Bacteroidia bacterium]|nr:hypothetical protein [Bacteroidia bacterium]